MKVTLFTLPGQVLLINGNSLSTEANFIKFIFQGKDLFRFR